MSISRSVIHSDITNGIMILEQPVPFIFSFKQATDMSYNGRVTFSINHGLSGREVNLLVNAGLVELFGLMAVTGEFEITDLWDITYVDRLFTVTFNDPSSSAIFKLRFETGVNYHHEFVANYQL